MCEMCVTIIYFLLVKLIKFSPIILYIASYQLWWIKIFKATIPFEYCLSFYF